MNASSTFPAIRGRCPWVPKGWRRRSLSKRRSRIALRSCAMAHVACAGSSRSLKSSTARAYGYGPVTERDVPGLFDADFLHNGEHALSSVWRTISLISKSTASDVRARGLIEPTSLDDYLGNGGYQGLRAALPMQPAEIVQAVTESGLRGRGGAAFPPASSGRRCWTRRRRRSTSPAMRTKATPARSRTAC